MSSVANPEDVASQITELIKRGLWFPEASAKYPSYKLSPVSPVPSSGTELSPNAQTFPAP